MKWLILASCALALLAARPGLADNCGIIGAAEKVRVHLAKGGRGWIEVTSALVGDSDDSNEFDVLAEYGATNRRTRVVNIGKGKRQVVSRGDFSDVLQMVKILDSSSPFLLSHNKEFGINWERGVLKVRLRFKSSDVTVNPSNKVPVIEVTTDGRFNENSGGEINQEGTKTIVNAARELVLEIEHLGVD